MKRGGLKRVLRLECGSERGRSLSMCRRRQLCVFLDAKEMKCGPLLTSVMGRGCIT